MIYNKTHFLKGLKSKIIVVSIKVNTEVNRD